VSESTQYIEFEGAFPLDAVMSSVAKQMRASFEGLTAVINHKGSKGTAREDMLRQFLSDYLPATLEIGTGEVVDLRGNRSNQSDLIIFDKAHCPKLVQGGGIRIYPAEGVRAGVEVKSKLDSSSLRDAVANIRQAKQLHKSAYYPLGNIVNSWTMYGKTFEYFPTMGYIFAYESIGLETLGKKLDALNSELKIPPEHQVDTICLLDKVVIAHINSDGKLVSWAEPIDPETGETKLTGVETKHSLLLFYIMIHDQLSIYKPRPVQMIRYMPKTMKFGKDEE